MAFKQARQALKQLMKVWKNGCTIEGWKKWITEMQETFKPSCPRPLTHKKLSIKSYKRFTPLEGDVGLLGNMLEVDGGLVERRGEEQ